MQELKITKEEDKLEKKCKCLNDQLASLKHTKQCFESGLKSLERDTFAEIAEKEQSITLIIKSNCFRNSMKEKKLLFWGGV